MKQIMIVAETVEDQLSTLFWELAGAAEYIMGLYPDSRVSVLVPGVHPAAAADQAAQGTGWLTLAAYWPGLVCPQTLTQGLCYLLDNLDDLPRPDMILMAHTTMGREAAPVLGVRLKACSVSGVSAVRRDEKGLILTRPVMDNSQVLLTRPVQDFPCIVTLLPGAFAGGFHEGQNGRGQVAEIQVPAGCLTRRVRSVEISPRAGAGSRLNTAKIVVGAGRGIGEQENLERISAFANRLPGACTGASRPLVDQGWVPYSRQVGITGATVTPELYVACGISGSSQHLAGMAGAKWVVSINKNPQAPICRHSDLCIQADINEFIDEYLLSK